MDYTEQDDPSTQEDVLVVWGGPGDINDENDTKMKKIIEIIETRGDAALLGICLGHQALCKYLWLQVRKLSKAQQWVQNTIKLFGKMKK